MENVLVVSNKENINVKLAAVFEFINQQSIFVEDLNSVTETIKANDFFMVIIATDFKEQEIIDSIKSDRPDLPIYVIQNHADLFPPMGITGLLDLPLDFNKLNTILQSSRNTVPTPTTKDTKEESSGILLTGKSPLIQRVKGLITHVAQTNSNVLILGESGTGKEVVARSIHNLSTRAKQPFVAVNCGAIPPDLLESELFGHEKGSFTGALSARRGRFEMAQGGTLFLDEIGDMPLEMQVKLLRIIQERAYERVGGSKTLVADVRIIAATHQNLEQRIIDGKFRTDLYYRLNVFPIDLPALRERSSDIPHFIDVFAKHAKNDLNISSSISLDGSAQRALNQYTFPGNIRELENLIERLSILYPGEVITEEMLPEIFKSSCLNPKADSEQLISSELSSKVNSHLVDPNLNVTPDLNSDINRFDLKQYLANQEVNLIKQALGNCDGIVSKAAKSLSLQRTTLIQKMHKYEIRINN